MIVRTYGRKSRGLTRSYSDVVSESASQECPDDVYNFAFSSQDSGHCHWSDPYSFTSTQESRELTILPSRKADGFDGGLWKRKKPEAIGDASEPYGSSSSQESQDDGVFEISGGEFRKSKVAKKINPDPYDYNSSQELEEFGNLPKRVDKSVYDFSENGDIWNSKTRRVDTDLYGVSSSQEFRGLGISEPRQCQGNRNRDSWEFDGIRTKSKKKNKKENGVLPKKKNKNKKKMKTDELELGDLVLTTTLMETQEYGEMMEHVDEVNFALDGLKKGQQVKIRRASLLSLLSICGTAQQRRLLRVHGMAKTIIDAVLGLSFDDAPSNLAAAALIYLLASDGQDDRLLDSPSCICFLIKLLKPLASTGAKEKTPTIGSKLLGMCRSAGLLHDSAKGTDFSSTAIMFKVQEILVNCKEMKPKDVIDNLMEEPKLNPKWFSLLTMEKASISTISIEDTSGAVRKMGGNFKEKLRDFGGLDAVFEVARSCHSIMEGLDRQPLIIICLGLYYGQIVRSVLLEGSHSPVNEEWLEKSPDYTLDKKDGLEGLVLLLKCLKIMENTTFLSKDNQCHLLEMRGKFDGQRAPRSFTKLILSVIKILSGVSLLRSSLSSTSDASNHSSGCGDMTDSQKSLSMSACNQGPNSGQPGSQYSLESAQMCADPLMLKMRVESSTAVSCSGTSGSLNSVIDISSNESELDVDFVKKQLTRTNLGVEDSEDPFAFDEFDCEPSKWDLLSGMPKKSLAKVNSGNKSENKDVNQSVMVFSQQESSKMEICHSQGASCSSAGDEERSNLLDDCLLTAVKVLMNLANDNPEGCRQIATCGGLEILSSLIAGHFPSFCLSPPHFSDVRESSLSAKSCPRIDPQSSVHLTDHELDFLVAILGLLVNLVEKDGRNRSRLAAVTVSSPSIDGLDLKGQSDVISLLCSIFLANHGAGEAAGEEDKVFSLEDEDSMLQGAKEAEKMIVEAYSALLLAFLSMESKTTRKAITECLPKQDLAIVVPVLEKFVEFHLTLNMISPETHSAVLEVIESCKIP